MIWCLEILRGWVIQAQVYLCCFPALQMNASATRLSVILESFSFVFGPSIQKSSEKDIFKQYLVEYIHQ